jgi:hypothetical protein
MPDDETTVLVTDGDDVFMAWHEEVCWRDCGTATVLHAVVAWMDMPEPPKTQRPNEKPTHDAAKMSAELKPTQASIL